MKIATARGIAAVLRREKEALLDDWEREVRQLPREDRLTSPVLRDDVPPLLDELTRDLDRLGTVPRAPDASRMHGRHRFGHGIELPEVIAEYKLLRICLVRRLRAAGLAPAADADRLLHQAIDDGINAAVCAYIERRDADEQRRRGEYLAFVVHDLRSPLTAIANAMQLLESGVARAPGAGVDVSLVGTVKRNVDRILALTVKLLQEQRNIHLAAHLEVRRSRVALRAAAEAAIATLSPSVRVAGTCAVNRVPEDLVVLADAELLERALENLLSNAIEHASGRTVAVEGSAVAERIECRVVDDGHGLPDAIKSRAFEAFHAHASGGAGLGLAVVRQIVEAHGGTIGLESDPGRGTTVRFSLPVPVATPD